MLAGAGLFLWPALLNVYPILFSDSGGFLEQALMPDSGWDKPWVYGPLLTPFHLRLTLWGAAAAQALILSAMLWMALVSLRGPRPVLHLITCAVLAGLSAAPWFASLLMPDLFAPVTVLGLWVLTSPHGRWGRAWVFAVTVLAIGSHLAHLTLAAACLVTIALVRWRLPWAGGLALLGTVTLVLASNLYWWGRPAISPYGQVFALARMVADGPAAQTIRDACPTAGWRLCNFVDRLPADSDDFLWDPHGPVWADGFGPLRIAPEASVIVRRTLAEHPVPLAIALLRNTARQLVRNEVGDTLTDAYLETAVTPRIAAYFPQAELDRFRRSLQARGLLLPLAERLQPVYAAALAAGLLGTVIVLLRWRQDRTMAGLAALVLIALLANAASTGGLSRPNDRYQARIAWLLLLPPLWAVSRPPAAPAGPLRPRRAAYKSCGG